MGKLSTFYNRHLKQHMPKSLNNYLSRLFDKEPVALQPFSNTANEQGYLQRISDLEQKVQDLAELNNGLTELARTQFNLYTSLEKRLTALIGIVVEDEKTIEAIIEAQKIILEILNTQNQNLKKEPGKKGDLN